MTEFLIILLIIALFGMVCAMANISISRSEIDKALHIGVLTICFALFMYAIGELMYG